MSRKPSDIPNHPDYVPNLRMGHGVAAGRLDRASSSKRFDRLRQRNITRVEGEEQLQEESEALDEECRSHEKSIRQSWEWVDVDHDYGGPGQADHIRVHHPLGHQRVSSLKSQPISRMSDGSVGTELSFEAEPDAIMSRLHSKVSHRTTVTLPSLP